MTSLLCALAALALLQSAPPDRSPTANHGANREANSHWLAAALVITPALAFAQNSAETTAEKSQRGSAPTPKERGPSATDTTQRGSSGSTAGGSERTGPPGAGIENGDANGLAGGRTDEGPAGGTGIRRESDREETQRAEAGDEARGPNRKGSLLRPADSPAQRNRNPKAMGSGAPNVPPGEKSRAQGRNYRAHRMEGNAGGAASGEDNPGGSSPAGSAGKSKRTQPEEHKADKPQAEPR